MHQPERAGAEDDRAVPLRHVDAVERVDDAAERLGQGGDPEVEPVRHPVQVLRGDPLRHEHLLREAAEQVLEVLAQALAPAPARPADAARRRVAAEHAVARRDVRDALADRPHHARELVAEPRRVARDRGMAARDGLHVGAAGERRADLEHDLARPGRRVGHGLDPQVARRVQDRGPHALLVTITLTPSRLRAVASAAAVPSSANRCVISRSARTAPPSISCQRGARVARARRVGRLDLELAEEQVVDVERPRLVGRGGGEQLDHRAAVGAGQREFPRGRGVGGEHDRVRRPAQRGGDRIRIRRDSGGAERSRQLAPLRQRLRDGHLRPRRQRCLRHQQPHLAAADHQQPRLAPHPRPLEAAHAAGQRLDQRRRLVGHGLRHDEHVARRVLRRHEDPLGEASGEDARRLERIAERLAPAPHSSQSPHGTWWWTKTRAPTSAAAPRPPRRRHDLAHRLVPEHHRRARVDVPLHEVAAADPAGAHRDQHLAVRRAPARRAPRARPPRRLVDRRLHDAAAAPSAPAIDASNGGAQHAGVGHDRGDERRPGVTSKAGFHTGTSSGSPAAARTSAAARCSISIARPVRRGGVERRARHRDVERHAVVVRERSPARRCRSCWRCRRWRPRGRRRRSPRRRHPAGVAPRPHPRSAPSPGCRRAGAPRPSAARPGAAGASRTRAPRPARRRRPWRRPRRAPCPSRRPRAARCCRASAAAAREGARRGRARRSAGTPRGPRRGSPAPRPRRRGRRARGRPPSARLTAVGRAARIIAAPSSRRPAFTASTTPNAPQIPIAGAPRTASRRIASTTSSGVSSRSTTSSAGSFVWSMISTASPVQATAARSSSLTPSPPPPSRRPPRRSRSAPAAAARPRG